MQKCCLQPPPKITKNKVFNIMTEYTGFKK